MFEVVARPNDWSKQVKALSHPASGAISSINAGRQDLFAEVLTQAIATCPGIKMPVRTTQNWVSFSSGPFGYWALSVTNTGLLRVEAYLDKGYKSLNKSLFDEMFADRELWQSKVGMELSWERLDDKRASRIASYSPQVVDVDDQERRMAVRNWAANALTKFYAGCNGHLRTRAAALKSEQNVTAEVVPTDAYSAPEDAAPDTPEERAAVARPL